MGSDHEFPPPPESQTFQDGVNGFVSWVGHVVRLPILPWLGGWTPPLPPSKGAQKDTWSQAMFVEHQGITLDCRGPYRPAP